MSGPDLWIGVDLGMTFTGVAYAARGWEQPKLIQDWPGKEGEFESKVPTVVTYDGKQLSSWGFECEDPVESEDPKKKEYKWFKLHLDEAVLEQANSKFTMKDIERWYKDFLSELYKHVKVTMMAQQRNAWKGKVQFLFSVPTTWNKATLNRYEKAIKDAGFGKEKGHKVSVTWTEAQAAAIYTAKNLEQTFKKNDVLLVCDAGGGTTDLAVLEETGNVKDGGVPQLKELDRVFGWPAGSTRIDKAFLAHAEERLNLFKHKHPNESKRIQDVEMAAEEMMKGRFQGYKCSFGKKISNLPKFKITIPSLAASFSSPECGVESGKLVVSSEQMAGFFNPQLEIIFNAIDHQLTNLHEKRRDKQVDYLVLSGGLGSSIYVMNEISKRYIDGPTAGNYKNIRQLTILRADDPRLAVVRGLVLDRTQNMSVGQPILKSYFSRANYGFLCVEPYNSEKHLLQDTYRDWDNKLYVNNQIHWVVEKGHDLTEDERIIIPCRRKIDPDSHDPLRGWKTTIVTSNNSGRFLPTNLSEGGVEELCILRSDLSQFNLFGGDFKEHKPRLFSKRKAYFTAKYEIRVLVGAADIKFELWFRSRRCGENSMAVTWGPGASVPVNPEVKDILDSK